MSPQWEAMPLWRRWVDIFGGAIVWVGLQFISDEGLSDMRDRIHDFGLKQ